MMREILHADCNAFYASVEQHHRPELRGKAMVVGGDEEQRHGIVLAKSEQAKRAGIRTGQTLREARNLCPELISVPPNFPLYLRYARLARAIFGEYTDRVEPYGLDEAWMDVTGQNGSAIADELRQRFKDELGVTISVGVAWNKVLAKLGSDLKKPDATSVICRENFREKVWPLAVEDLLYVGSATSAKLNDYGIYTIGQLADCDDRWLKSWFGVKGPMLGAYARGQDITPVSRTVDMPVDPFNSIGHSNTMYRDLIDEEDVKDGMYVMAEAVASRLRDHAMRCNVVEISVRDNQLASYIKQRRLKTATCLSGEITGMAMDLFRESYRWQRPVRSIGVRGSDLVPMTGPQQMDIWGAALQRERREGLEKTIDGLRTRFGHDAILRASLLRDRSLGGLNPKGDNIIHPVSYFKGGHMV